MVPPPDLDQVRTAEVAAALCLATDLGMGLPFEQGLQSAVVAMRLAERLGVDEATRRQSYYGCLLFYAGCTADAEVQASLFPEGALLERWTPVMFGSSREATVGILTALAAGDGVWPKRALRAAGRLPGAVAGHRRHVAACARSPSSSPPGSVCPPTSQACSGTSPNGGTATVRWVGRGAATSPWRCASSTWPATRCSRRGCGTTPTARRSSGSAPGRRSTPTWSPRAGGPGRDPQGPG